MDVLKLSTNLKRMHTSNYIFAESLSFLTTLMPLVLFCAKNFQLKEYLPLTIILPKWDFSVCLWKGCSPTPPDHAGKGIVTTGNLQVILRKNWPIFNF